MTMGERIKALRIQHGLSQEELGKICGVNKTAVFKWEQGIVENIKRTTIYTMADLFHVSPNYIMAFDDDPDSGIKSAPVNLSSTKQALIDLVSDMSDEQAEALYHQLTVFLGRK